MVKLYLSDRMTGRINNLDFIRLVAALMVIYAHSFPLSLGRGNVDSLDIITDGQLDAGTLGVSIFFILSGFLITMSYERSRGLIYFFKSRVLRLFPALFVIIILTIFVLGPIVTSLNVIDYFNSASTYTYFKNVILFKMQWKLPGVFDNNVYKGAINGSLWTLKYEFACYVVVAMLGLTKLLKKRPVLFLFIFSVICDIPVLNGYVPHPQYVHFFIFFSLGMVIYLYRDNFYLNSKLALLSMFAFSFLIFTGIFKFTYFFFVGYLLFYIGYHQKIRLTFVTKKLGDISYGVYIIAFPIQQTIVFIFGGTMSPWHCLLLSAPLTMLLAFGSWHIVEKRALKLKKKPFLKQKLNPKINKTA